MPVPEQPNLLDLYKVKPFLLLFELWVLAHFEEKCVHCACALVTDLDLAGAGKTASTAAGSVATGAKAALPGPTFLACCLKYS